MEERYVSAKCYVIPKVSQKYLLFVETESYVSQTSHKLKYLANDDLEFLVPLLSAKIMGITTPGSCSAWDVTQPSCMLGKHPTN